MKRIIALLLFPPSLLSYGQNPSSHFLGLKYADVSKLENVDYVLSPKITQGVLKASIDLSADFPQINLQGNIGSCASWASVYGVRSYIQKKKENYSYMVNNVLDESKVFSPLFVFNQVKEKSNMRCDSVGSYIKDNLELMKKTGACKKNTFDPKPYNYLSCGANPLDNLQAVNEAKDYKINSYGWFARYGESYAPGYKLLKMKEFLNKGYPVIFGADIDYTFWTVGGNSISNNKIWNKFDGIPVGSHAMVCVGYNDALKAIKVFNSWGTNWGNQGYGWIAYSMIDNSVFEAYVVNIDELNTANTINVISNPLLSQASKKKQGSSDQDVDSSFFVTNRYQPYDGIRIMPIKINKRLKSAIIKLYEIEKSKPVEIDIFSLSVGETYTFSNNNKNYEFSFEEIKPWRFLGQNAVFYTLKWSN